MIISFLLYLNYEYIFRAASNYNIHSSNYLENQTNTYPNPYYDYPEQLEDLNQPNYSESCDLQNNGDPIYPNSYNYEHYPQSIQVATPAYLVIPGFLVQNYIRNDLIPTMVQYPENYIYEPQSTVICQNPQTSISQSSYLLDSRNGDSLNENPASYYDSTMQKHMYPVDSTEQMYNSDSYLLTDNTQTFSSTTNQDTLGNIKNTVGDDETETKEILEHTEGLKLNDRNFDRFDNSSNSENNKGSIEDQDKNEQKHPAKSELSQEIIKYSSVTTNEYAKECHEYASESFCTPKVSSMKAADTRIEKKEITSHFDKTDVIEDFKNAFQGEKDIVLKHETQRISNSDFDEEREIVEDLNLKKPRFDSNKKKEFFLDDKNSSISIKCTDFTDEEATNIVSVEKLITYNTIEGNSDLLDQNSQTRFSSNDDSIDCDKFPSEHSEVMQKLLHKEEMSEVLEDSLSISANKITSKRMEKIDFDSYLNKRKKKRKNSKKKTSEANKMFYIRKKEDNSIKSSCDDFNEFEYIQQNEEDEIKIKKEFKLFFSHKKLLLFNIYFGLPTVQGSFKLTEITGNTFSSFNYKDFENENNLLDTQLEEFYMAYDSLTAEHKTCILKSMRFLLDKFNKNTMDIGLLKTLMVICLFHEGEYAVVEKVLYVSDYFLSKIYVDKRAELPYSLTENNFKNFDFDYLKNIVLAYIKFCRGNKFIKLEKKDILRIVEHLNLGLKYKKRDLINLFK